jgi:hypothetical protein
MRHQLELIQIQRESIAWQMKQKDANKDDLSAQLASLNAKEQIVRATKEQLDAQNAINAKTRAAMTDEQTRLQDRLEIARLVGQSALDTLPKDAKPDDKMRLQTKLAEDLYQIQSDALDRDGTLTDEQLSSEKLKLDLAHQRELIQIRLNALGKV